MSEVEEIQSLINEAEQLRDAGNYTEARRVVASAIQKAMTARNNSLIRTAMNLRNSIQQASVTQQQPSSNRCMDPNPPADLQCCSDVYEAEESEVQKRLDANDGTVVVQYQVRDDLIKYVCFNRSVLQEPSRLRSQTVRLCSPIAATTNSEMMYGFANNRVSTRKIKYVVKPSDKVGDQIKIDVPQSDGSTQDLDVTIPSHIDKYKEPLQIQEHLSYLSEELENATRELDEYTETTWTVDQSVLMLLEEAVDNARDRLADANNRLSQASEDGVKAVEPGDLIYFDTENIREGPAGSEELYVKLRFFGLDVGGVIDFKDFLYQVIGFPEINRFVITQRSPEVYIMLSNGLSVDSDVSRTYHEFDSNLDQALDDVIDNVEKVSESWADWDDGTLHKWVREQIDKTGPVYSGEDDIKKNASEAARSIQVARSEVGAVTDATSASHCQLGQETTVWQIEAVNPIDVTSEQKEQAMTKVMEMYSSAQYKPVTIQDLRRQVLDIMKDAYKNKPEELEHLTLLDPSTIDINDLETVHNHNHSDEESYIGSDIESRGDEQIYRDLDEARGVSQLRCFLANNIVEVNNNYDSGDVERIAAAFNIDQVPYEIADRIAYLPTYLDYEVDNMNSRMQGNATTAERVCEDYDVAVDGPVDDPRSYRIVVRAFGNRLFGSDDDDEPQGEMEVNSDSEDEFERGAQQVSNNLGFISEDDRFNSPVRGEQTIGSAQQTPEYNSSFGSRGDSLHLSHLNSTENSTENIADDDDDLLSEVGSLHSSDNDSVASLDLNDFAPPGSPTNRAPTTPIQLAPRLSDGVQGVEDLNEPTTPTTPPPDLDRNDSMETTDSDDL
jgi:hypothetical protein